MASGTSDAVRLFHESVSIDPAFGETQHDQFELRKRKDSLMSKSIELFNRMCMSAAVPPDERYACLKDFVKYIPDAGYDMLARFRDMVPHLRGRDDNVSIVILLSHVVSDNSFSDRERYTTAVCLYNNYEYWKCYDCFTQIAFDMDMDYSYRADASRYLFATEEREHVISAQEALLDVIENMEIPSDKRYQIVVSFVSKTGISTIMASSKLRVKYNEEFVCALQTVFFYNRRNGIRERILSGQNLLQIADSTEPRYDDDGNEKEKLIGLPERTKIIEEFFAIVRDSSYDENTRADAADVIVRMGDEEQQTRANMAIKNLGFAGVTPNASTSCMAFLGKTDTIYNNSQNIHEFSEQISRAMERLVLEVNVIKPYSEIYESIVKLIKKYAMTQGVPDNKKKFSALRALSRVNMDTAVFGSYNLTLPELLSRVYTYIITREEKEDRHELKKRLVDELIDMGDTCGSGHADRFVNVLQGYFFDLKVSFKEQIKSNLEGRIQKAIRECDDDNVKEVLTIIQTPAATTEDKEVYRAFLDNHILRIRDELTEEFVGGGHLSIEEFDTHFTQARKKWMFETQSGTS